MEAAQSATLTRGSSTGLVSRNHSASQIKKLLESRNDREVLDGMRKVIAVRLGQSNRAVTWTDYVPLCVTPLVDVFVRAFPSFLLICRQERRKHEYRSEETGIHIPGSSCGDRARPCAFVNQYDPKITYGSKPSSASDGFTYNVWDQGTRHQPDCLPCDQTRLW